MGPVKLQSPKRLAVKQADFLLRAFVVASSRHLASLHPPEDNLVRVETRMSKAEIALCSDPTPHPPAPEPLNYATDAAADTLIFRGVRWRTKFSFCLKMYAEEVKVRAAFRRFSRTTSSWGFYIRAWDAASMVTPG